MYTLSFRDKMEVAYFALRGAAQDVDWAHLKHAQESQRLFFDAYEQTYPRMRER